MSRSRPSPLHAEHGFTLVELLVVILIVGILAAIAIPSFLSQKNEAVDTNAKAVVRTAQLAQETYDSDAGHYASAAAALVVLDATLGAWPTLVAEAPNTNPLGATTPGGAPAETAVNSFDVEITSATGVAYAIVRHSDGTVEHVCSVPVGIAAGGCRVAGGASAGDGAW